MALSSMARAEEFETVLRRHVLDPWFPRSLDRQYGGFLCDFDRSWKHCGPHEKLLEFQARQTLAAAEASRAYPSDQRLRDATLHGFRYLREVMWDGDSGGWFHLMDRAGRPLEAHTKHVHGAAYAIEACVAVHEATGEAAALSLAQQGFEWLERFARDQEHGGYFGFLTRENAVIGRPSDCPWKSDCDTIGTELGLKDLNVHSDLLETFVYLYRVWPDPLVGERLAEVLDILSDKMLVPSTGALHFFVTPDWRPIPHFTRAGYQVQTAYRITLAIGLTGDGEKLRRTSVSLIDHALRYTRDADHGGFLYAAPGAAPSTFHEQDVRVSHKAWWVQMEALKALLALSRLAPDAGPYLQHFEAQWRYVQRHVLDLKLGGVYMGGQDVLPRWRRRLGPRFSPAALTRKGDVWKDASHECRALLYCIETFGAKPA